MAVFSSSLALFCFFVVSSITLISGQYPPGPVPPNPTLIGPPPPPQPPTLPPVIPPVIPPVVSQPPPVYPPPGPQPPPVNPPPGPSVTGTTQPIPDSKFTCTGQKYGYYADVDLGCTIFHVCWNDLKWSFWCPPGTLFSQHYLVCEHTVDVVCADSSKFLWVNDNFNTNKQFLQQRK